MTALEHKSLAVACPVCRAAPGLGCTAPRKPGGLHAARTRLGVRAVWRNDSETHTAAEAALLRVRRAARRGAPIDDRDVVGAVACVCPDECDGVDKLVCVAAELRKLGALPELDEAS